MCESAPVRTETGAVRNWRSAATAHEPPPSFFHNLPSARRSQKIRSGVPAATLMSRGTLWGWRTIQSGHCEGLGEGEDQPYVLVLYAGGVGVQE